MLCAHLSIVTCITFNLVSSIPHVPSHLYHGVGVPDPHGSVFGARHDGVSVGGVPLPAAQPAHVTLGILHVADVHVPPDEFAALLAITVIDLGLRRIVWIHQNV